MCGRIERRLIPALMSVQNERNMMPCKVIAQAQACIAHIDIVFGQNTLDEGRPRQRALPRNALGFISILGTQPVSDQI